MRNALRRSTEYGYLHARSARRTSKTSKVCSLCSTSEQDEQGMLALLDERAGRAKKNFIKYIDPRTRLSYESCSTYLKS